MSSAQTSPSPSPESTLVSVLQSVGAELDDLASRVQRLAASAGGDVATTVGCQGSCRRVERYRVAVRDAVQVLERTRTSFRSKELGALRRALEALLFEETP